MWEVAWHQMNDDETLKHKKQARNQGDGLRLDNECEMEERCKIWKASVKLNKGSMRRAYKGVK
jgi:hypothetical protein